MIEEPPSLPVFIVTGVNFTVEVKLDEYNAGFDLMHQQYEAATRAIEMLKNAREDDSCHVTMNPDSRGENPKAGVTVLVHEKGTDPEKALPIPTYLCFANFGAYDEANTRQDEFNKKFAEKKKQIEAAEKQRLKDAADLDLMTDRAPKKVVKKDTKKKKK